MSVTVVTGAAGFIGGHLVEALTARGEQVVGIDRRLGIPDCAEALQADLLDGDSRVACALAEAEVVFHLAGAPGVRTSGPDVAARRRRDNVAAGKVVLDVVRPQALVVIVSSSSVYGGADSVVGLRSCSEIDPARPLGGYARSKLALEALAWERLSRAGRVAVARPFTVAGERQRPDMALARWIEALHGGAPVRVYGSVARTRDLTDVRDVVEGLIRIAERDITGPVNLGSGVGHTLQELIDVIARVLEVEPRLEIEPAVADDPRATLADTRRCRRLLGYVPVTDLEGLVRRQVAASPAGQRSVVAEAA